MYFCRKELIQKLHNFVHLNLCIALSLGLFLFLTGIQTATANIVRDVIILSTVYSIVAAVHSKAIFLCYPLISSEPIDTALLHTSSQLATFMALMVLSLGLLKTYYLQFDRFKRTIHLVSREARYHAPQWLTWLIDYLRVMLQCSGTHDSLNHAVITQVNCYNSTAYCLVCMQYER